MSEIEVGTRVRLARDVERYPHFIAEEGRTGTVTRIDQDQISVELDTPLEGAEEWGNQLHWYADMFAKEDFENVFRRDVERVS